MDCTKHKDMGVVQIELKQTTNDLRQMYALLMAAGLALSILPLTRPCVFQRLVKFLVFCKMRKKDVWIAPNLGYD